MTQEPKQYFEKVLVGSGELPDYAGPHFTSTGMLFYLIDELYQEKQWMGVYKGQNCEPTFWLKPYYPKEEAIKFAEWIKEEGWLYNGIVKEGLFYYKNNVYHTTSELYDKFKEEMKSKEILSENERKHKATDLNTFETPTLIMYIQLYYKALIVAEEEIEEKDKEIIRLNNLIKKLSTYPNNAC